MNIDFIGDIHGNFTKLNKLLDSMEYEWDNEEQIFIHNEGRKICVLGDFINVGMENEKVLDLLYNMYLKKQAYVVAGNHEYFISLLYNKIAKNKNLFWHYIQRNYFTLYQEFANKRDKFYFYLDWINTLPVFLEFDYVKVVHAFWDDNIIDKIRNINNVKTIIEEAIKDANLKDEINKILIGIIHKYNVESENFIIYFRYRWWDYDKNLPLQNMFIHKTEKLPFSEVQKINRELLNFTIGNYIIFFGHYNLQGYPHLTHSLRCCLDFGGAKGGFLTAYRWNGEKVLSESNLIWV